MRDPIRSTRRSVRRELRRLRSLKDRLWRRAGHLAHVADLGGPQARAAGMIGADLECLLVDHLAPAVDALERLSVERPLPAPENGDQGPGS